MIMHMLWFNFVFGLESSFFFFYQASLNFFKLVYFFLNTAHFNIFGYLSVIYFIPRTGGSVG